MVWQQEGLVAGETEKRLETNKGHLVPLRTRGLAARWGDVAAWPGACLAVTTSLAKFHPSG